MTGGLRPSTDDSTPAVDQLWLRLDEWGDQPLLVCLTEEGIIGRDFRSDLVVHDDEASRMHARVSPSDPGWTVVDLATTNGTPISLEMTFGMIAMMARNAAPTNVTRISTRSR